MEFTSVRKEQVWNLAEQVVIENVEEHMRTRGCLFYSAATCGILRAMGIPSAIGVGGAAFCISHSFHGHLTHGVMLGDGKIHMAGLSNGHFHAVTLTEIPGTPVIDNTWHHLQEKLKEMNEADGQHVLFEAPVRKYFYGTPEPTMDFKNAVPGQWCFNLQGRVEFEATELIAQCESQGFTKMCLENI